MLKPWLSNHMLALGGIVYVGYAGLMNQHNIFDNCRTQVSEVNRHCRLFYEAPGSGCTILKKALHKLHSSRSIIWLVRIQTHIQGYGIFYLCCFGILSVGSFYQLVQASRAPDQVGIGGKDPILHCGI